MGYGKVIIADDEPLLVRLLECVLSKNGWETVTCTTGEQAVLEAKIISSGNADLKGILFDLGMLSEYGMVRTREILRSYFPGVKLIAMSGDVRHPAMTDPENNGFDASLPKPFTSEELISLFGNVFDI